MSKYSSGIGLYKVWFAIFFVPITISYIYFYPIDNIFHLLFLILVPAFSFLIILLTNRKYIKRREWYFVAIFLSFGDLFIYFLTHSIRNLLIGILVIIIWIIMRLFINEISLNWIEVNLISIISPILLCLIPYYLISNNINLLLLALIINYSLFLSVFTLLHWYNRILELSNKKRNFLCILLYVAGYAIIVASYFCLNLNISIMLIFLLSYYSWRNIDMLFSKEFDEWKIEDRAYNFAMYAWLFHFIYLIGQKAT